MTSNLPDDFFGWVVFLIQKYGELFIEGAVYTLILALVVTVIGCIIGFLVGIIRKIEVQEDCNKLISIH